MKRFMGQVVYLVWGVSGAWKHGEEDERALDSIWDTEREAEREASRIGGEVEAWKVESSGEVLCRGKE